jgi:hypothetical protein
MKGQQQDPIFTSQAAYRAALKALIAFIQFRFKTLATDAVEDIACTALAYTYTYAQLNVPVLAFAKMVAARRAADEVRREAVKKRYLALAQPNDFFYPNTEGVCVLDDAEMSIVEAIIGRANKLSPDCQKLFWSDVNADIEEFTDDKKAELLGLKASGLRKRRCDNKRAILQHIQQTPQYLTVSYRWQQRA